MSKGRILICDDEMLIRMWLEEHLKDEGYQPASVGDGSSLLRALEEEPADLVLLDLKLPDAYGIDLIPQIHELAPDLPVIMITAFGEVETAVAAVHAGAHHFLEKPIQLPELLLLIDQALEKCHLRRELERYREGYRWQFKDVSLVGRSRAIQGAAEVITRVALKGTPTMVLIRGESGTGKDVVACAIHAQGPRSARPFVRVNCTAIPENLVESELFGHEGGAFTGARERKKGLFELADRGTLFLDEIGDMPLAAQGKLLGVLEEHALRRVGGVRDVKVDVHVLAATNRDLEDAVALGEFREDLFYRLNVLPIYLPPLRERREDIIPLAYHFLEHLSKELRQPSRSLSVEAAQAFECYDWPGNAREMSNVLERILLLSDAETIDLAMLPADIRSVQEPPETPFVLPAEGMSLDSVEKELILQALERTDGNKSAAARLLGLSRDTLRYRLEKYDMG